MGRRRLRGAKEKIEVMVERGAFESQSHSKIKTEGIYCTSSKLKHNEVMRQGETVVKAQEECRNQTLTFSNLWIP